MSDQIKQNHIKDRASTQYPNHKPAYGVWLFLFSIAANLLLLAMPLYLSQIYERIIPSSSQDTLLYLTLFMLFCVLLFGVMEMLRTMTAQKMSAHYELTTEKLLIDTAVRRDARDSAPDPALLNEIALIQQVLASRAFISLFDLPFAPFFLFVLFLVHPWLGALASLGALLLIFIALVNEWSTMHKQHKISAMDGQTRLQNVEILAMRDDVVAMGMGGAMSARSQESALSSALQTNQIAKINSFYFGLVRFLRQALQLSILGCGAYLVLTENLSAGLIFAASIISGRALMPIEQIIGSWRQLAAARSGYRNVEKQLQHQQTKQSSRGQTSLPTPEGNLRCEHVFYLPDPHQPDKAIVKDISFEAAPGEVIAVIGASGAGKTTLLRILATALMASRGKVLFDGFEVHQWEAEQLGKHIGYSAQDISFFQGSVAQNIARFNDTASDEDIIKAASNAGAHSFIGTLPNGYETIIDSASFSLSGGQKRRINLARAFFRDPQFLFLDEPDAHLDQEGENALKSAIYEARARRKTVIFATQRMHLVTVADKVMVLERGSVSQFGPKAEIFKPRKASFALNGSYRNEEKTTSAFGQPNRGKNWPPFKSKKTKHQKLGSAKAKYERQADDH
ncbi:MAG: type I secretion system permease/ATPase [Cohaesibacter sp.]|jgi:PrtD family type I secretion system ABC transporter|nr:type I secretion system permease/ATPase [Cohaesibacter sp.]